MNKQKIYRYGKYAATGVVGIGVGLAGYAATDTPTQNTDTYQNLEKELTQAQQNADNFEQQVADLETTVTTKEGKISNLESQVTQFEETVTRLREENEDLEETIASGNERTGIVDYFPVFTENTDVEYDVITVESVDDPADDLDGVTDSEGDYTQIDVETVDGDEGHEYDATVVEFEEAEDADDYEDHERDYVDEVSFSADGDEHTVGVSVKEVDAGELEDKAIQIEYEDDDVLQDVDDEDEIESVVVDGEDITDEISDVYFENSGERLVIDFEDGNYVNEEDEISVTFSEADGDEAPEWVKVNGNGEYEYDQDADEFVFRDGNTVVTGEGFEDDTGDEDDYDAQYNEFVAQYE